MTTVDLSLRRLHRDFGRSVPGGMIEPVEAGPRDGQIARAAELVRGGRSVVLAAERGAGRTTALRAVLKTVSSAMSDTPVVVSASESARWIPLGALAGLVELEPTMSPTEGVFAAVEGLRARGSVLAVDDADLLDDESATVLLALVRFRPLLLTVNSGATMPDAVARIARDHATVLALEPLGAGELLAIAEQRLGGLLDTGSLERLSEGVGGNPGLLLRRVDEVVRDRTLRDRHGVWCLERGTARRPVPGSHRNDESGQEPEAQKAVNGAETALRHGKPETAARYLAPLAGGWPGIDQGLVSARLRWALAWSGRATAEVLHAVGTQTAESRLVDAHGAAELGDDHRARATAMAIATSAHLQPGTRIDAFHFAGRLHLDASVVPGVAAMIRMSPDDASRPFRDAQLAHLRGLDRNDARVLEGAAEQFLGLDHPAMAHEAMTQAAHMHQLTGAPRHAGRCRAAAENLAAASGLRPTFAARRAAHQLPLLTRRERDVVGLIAGGRSLREVATELGCSPRTAESHLQHAYVKLGVSDRTALRSLIATGS